jgi:uncharacterized protein YjhX (UPF0386 family)
MNISKTEQRVLHALAQGGAIHFERAPNGKLQNVSCYTRDGHMLVGLSLAVFERLRKRRFVHSRQGQPYRITPLGTRVVRAQADNR